PPVDGANGLKGLFSSVARTKTNAPNKSGRFVGPSSVCFHTVCSGGFFILRPYINAMLARWVPTGMLIACRGDRNGLRF
ncbi:hypothetical protein, partial [Pseudomonas sp. RA_15y_Pfl2_54]